MSTGGGVIGFNGVGLDDIDNCFRLGGDGQQRQGSSRLIDLGGGGVFDPDAGVAAPQGAYQIQQEYWVKSPAFATVNNKLIAIREQWQAYGTITFAYGATVDGRLVTVSDSSIVPAGPGRDYVAHLTCTWEVIP